MRGAGAFLEHLNGFLPSSAIKNMMHAAEAHPRPSTFRIMSTRQQDMDCVLESITQEILAKRPQGFPTPSSPQGESASSTGCEVPVTFLRSPWFTAAHSLLLDRPLVKSEIQALSAVKHGQVYFQARVLLLPREF